MLRVNTTAGRRGAEQGRTVGTQTNTTAHLSKYVLRAAAPGGPFPLTVDSLVPPYPDSPSGKNLSWHTETNRRTKKFISEGGGGNESWLPHRVQGNTVRLNLLC